MYISAVAINVMLQLYLWCNLFKLYIAQGQYPLPPPMDKIVGVHLCVCVCVRVCMSLYSVYFRRATHSVEIQAIN
jgi:hypothetical protein